MPTEDRVRSDEEDRPAVAAEHASERGEDRSVLGFEARSRDLALQDGELMAQHENLDILGTIPAATQHQQVDHESDKTVETGHAWILAASEPRRSCLRETAGHHAGRVFGTHRVTNPTKRVPARAPPLLGAGGGPSPPKNNKRCHSTAKREISKAGDQVAELIAEINEALDELDETLRS